MLMGFCCCATVNCEIGSDDFNRSSVGSDWDDIAGTWIIDSNELETTSSNGQLKYQTNHPNSVASHWVTVKVKGDTSGDQARIWLAADLYVELEFATDGCGYLRLYDVSGLLKETRVEGATLDTWHTLKGCYHYGDTVADERFVGSFLSGTTLQTFTLDILPGTSASGIYVGLATGIVTGIVNFDDFDYESYKNDDLECRQCLTCLIWEPISEAPDASAAWNQVSGTWTASATVPLLAASGTAKVVSNVIHSSDGPNFKLTCILYAPYFTEDVLRVYCPYNTGESDSVYVEIKLSTYNAPGGYYNADGYIKFYDGNSLLSQYIDVAVPGVVTVTICVQQIDTNYYATFIVAGAIPYDTWEYTSLVTSIDGNKIAFYGDTSFGFWVQDIEWYRAYSVHDYICEKCFEPNCPACPEDDEDLPETWTVALDIDLDEGCDDCDDLDGSHILPYAAVCTWTKSIWTCSDYYDPGYEGYITLEVISDGGNNIIQVWLYQGSECWTRWRKTIPATTECNSIEDLELDYYDAQWLNASCCVPVNLQFSKIYVTAN